MSGKPLVLHVHATEFDRSGGGENAFVAAIERFGLAAADRIVAVSAYTADLLVGRYAVARRAPARRAQRDRSAGAARGREAGQPQPARPLRRPDHLAEGPRLLRRGGRARGRRAPGRPVRRRRLRRPHGRDAGARGGARPAQALPLHGLSPGRGARPPLRAGGRLRHAVAVRALRPDGARGAAARNAGHRVPVGGRGGGRAQRPARRVRRRRGPGIQDPVRPGVPAAAGGAVRARSRRRAAPVLARFGGALRRRLPGIGGRIAGTRHDPGLPVLPGPPAVPAQALQLLRRRTRPPLFRRHREPGDPAPRRRPVLHPRHRPVRAAARAPSRLRRRVLALGLRAGAVAGLGARGAGRLRPARPDRAASSSSPRPPTTRSRGSRPPRSSRRRWSCTAASCWRSSGWSPASSATRS